MPSLRTTFLLSISFVALFALPTLVSAASYYVSPNGGGSTCSSVSPCSLNEGLSKAGGGDEVVLKSGVYPGNFTTRRSGGSDNHVTIRSENVHGAIFHRGGRRNACQIDHNYVTIRGIVCDNQKEGDMGVMFGYQVHHVIFEQNKVINTGASGIHLTQGQHDIIIRHNIIDGTGYREHWGEAFYVGGKTSESVSTTVYNVQIYGNNIRNFTENGIDAKPYSRDIQIHHNIFSGQVPAVEHGATGGVTSDRGQANHGTITVLGNKFDIHDNIMHDNKAGFGHLVITPYSDTVAYRNVAFRDKPKTTWAIRAWFPGDSNGKAVSKIYNNTFCTLSTYSVQNDPGLTTNNNIGLPGGVPQSQCDAEVARITNELKSLPGAGSGFPEGGIGTLVFTPGPCSLYPAGSATFSPYGLHWDWTSAQRELLLKATCETDSTTLNIGNGREVGSGATMAGLTYVYHQGYYNNGSGGWQPYSLQCSGNDKTKIANVWCKGSAAASLPISARWFVAYTCIWTGAKWQCGCSDSTCATSYWQVQGIRR